jgi:pteridine reductase
VTNKVALITGSGKKRVGWHVADALAGRGYCLAIHYRSSAVEAAETIAYLRGRGVEAEAVQADLADEEAVRLLVASTINHFGRIDVLANCAGIWESKPLEQVTAADVRRHFEINALGTFLCCQHAGLAMARQAEGGSIVNFGDWAEVRPYMNYAAYFPSKGAVSTLTRCLAVELAARNPRVRVNCVLPGPIMLPPDMAESERRQVIDATLVKEEGRPENAVQAVLFFVENDFVTGVCLPVDGGRSVYAPE